MTKQGSNLQRVDIDSKTLGESVPATVLLPPGFDPGGDSLPLFIELHGAGGDRTEFEIFRPWVDEMFRAGTLCPAVLVMCSAPPFGMYAGAWEGFLADELPEWMAKNFGTRSDREGVVLWGISMGGYGALKIGLKRPELFAAIAGMAPAILPSFERLPDHTRNSWLTSAELEVDEGWGSLADQPANVARDNAEAIRSSGLEIYLECGDKDGLNLHDGAEFLHRVLWDHDIRHEYHLVRGADHCGVSLERRYCEMHAFLVAALREELEEPIDLPLTESEKANALDYQWGVDHERDPSIQEFQMKDMRETAAGDPDLKRAYAKLPPTA